MMMVPISAGFCAFVTTMDYGENIYFGRKYFGHKMY